MVHNPDLTSSELAAVWSSYMGDSLNICVMKHFAATVVDPEVKEIVEFSKDLSEGHLNTLKMIFQKENLLTPQGYTDADVNDKTPKLYSDIFYLRFIQMMARYGCFLNGNVLGTTYREDIRAYYTAATEESSELYNRVVKLMESKGILIRSPYIAYPKKIEFVDDTSFFTGHLTLNKRPLLAIEITHLANNIEMNYVGRTMVDGLAQITKSKEVRKHMQAGYDLATEIINTLEKTLKDEHLSTPTSPDSTMTNSTESPFTEKLLIGLNSTLSVISIGSLGLGLGASMRSDLVAEYAQLITRVGKFGVVTGTIAVHNKWMEKPPQTVDRKKLQNKIYED
ncbi:DUF3231 family protein [Bacillus infantis]|uniref:DUF3231 family protein n=1 Tax=Bacillus infantis TaxID=324767 RepID=UPI003CF1DE2D